MKTYLNSFHEILQKYEAKTKNVRILFIRRFYDIKDDLFSSLLKQTA